MSQYTEWRDKQISFFQARRAEAIQRYYVPGIAAFLIGSLGLWLKWSHWVTVPSFVVFTIATFLADRHTKCPFCKKTAVNVESRTGGGFDPDVCPHCSMRLKRSSK